MESFIFNGDMLCEDCGKEVIRDLNAEAVAAYAGEHAIPSVDLYQSDSEAWARKHPKTLAKALGFDPADESSYDSTYYPKDGGGEADSPQHCSKCDLFLENPLTMDGEEYVIESMLDHLENPADGDALVLLTWWNYYSDNIDSSDLAEALSDRIASRLREQIEALANQYRENDLFREGQNGGGNKALGIQ